MLVRIHRPLNIQRDLQTMCNRLTVRRARANVKHYSYHASTSVIVSGGVGMQQCMIQNQMKCTSNSAKSWLFLKQANNQVYSIYLVLLKTGMDAHIQQYKHKTVLGHFSLTFSKIHDISLTAVKIPDISSFSIQAKIAQSRKKIEQVWTHAQKCGQCWKNKHYSGHCNARRRGRPNEWKRDVEKEMWTAYFRHSFSLMKTSGMSPMMRWWWKPA